MEFVLNVPSNFPFLRWNVFRGTMSVAAITAAVFMAQGCRAQSTQLTPELSRKIAITIRNKAQVPFYVDVAVKDRRPSKFPDYDEITAVFTVPDRGSQESTFLITKDNKTLGQFNTFSLGGDPRDTIAEGNRPARGGPENAPVRIVVFDDLQCPFCAKMHKALFPAILARYGDKVRIVYKDFPLSQHPWAIHAAVDANCLAAQTTPGYWEMVDSVHGRLGEIGKDPLANTSQSKPDTADAALARAKTELDRIALDAGKRHNVNSEKLQACIKAQDDSAIKTSQKQAEDMGVDAAPLLYINGEKIAGAVPIEYVYKAVDDALTAAGVTPPPAVPLPKLGEGQ